MSFAVLIAVVVWTFTVISVAWLFGSLIYSEWRERRLNDARRERSEMYAMIHECINARCVLKKVKK